MDVRDLVSPGVRSAMMPRIPHGLRRVAAHPVTRFAVIGAALFAASGALQRMRDTGREPTRPAVVISADRIRLLRAEFEQRWGTPPSPAQLGATIDRVVEEEILYREARALAFDYKDRSVRRRMLDKARAVTSQPVAHIDDLYKEALALGLDDDLVIRRLLAEKMRLFLQQDPAAAPLNDAVLADYMERHRERFVQPEAVTLTHVFFGTGTHRDRLMADASAARNALGGEAPSPAVVALSDPFPLGNELRAYTPRQLLARFGKRFADQVLALPTGAWSPPLMSPYGLHLVWVHEHQPEQLPPLDEVRETVQLAIMQERAGRNLQAGLARLRRRYDVRIDAAL